MEPRLRELEALRGPLFQELGSAPGRATDTQGAAGEPPHVCCTRKRNQMRISPLEAQDIASALRRDPNLRAKLPQILSRVRQEARRLEDNSERQNFDCPLLEGTRCLVHRAAKPIGCLAWHDGRDFSPAGWKAFAARDELNDDVYGSDWKLRVIPLWLQRVVKPQSDVTV